MSFSSSGTNDSTRLNQAAAHDTGIYDPAVHDNQIVAMYNTDAQARTAQQQLVDAGFPASAMQLVSSGTAPETLGGINAEDENGGVWGAIKSLFVPEDDRAAYSHAVGRGHAMLVVHPTTSMDRTKLVHALEATDPVDFDAKLEEWRQAGYDTSTAHEGYTASLGAAATMPTGYAAASPDVVGTATDSTVTDRAAVASMPAAAGTETLKVMEERLRVGKREVNTGAVRIRSYVVERPVEEQVSLHEERVNIERRPVDRSATAADMGAFQERTIEARGTAEEAVVSKEARVVEEIGLSKTGSDRVETVRDTVRKTEVEVEGTPSDVAGGRTGSAVGGTSSPVSTPDAGTSGANSPRK